MKKTFRCLSQSLFLIAIISLAACSNEQGRDLSDGDPVINIDETDFSILARLGFDATSAADMGDYYLVEGDIAIPKENMNGYAELLAKDDTSRLKQARSNYLVSVTNIADLKIMVDPSLSHTSDWNNSIIQAIYQYNHTLSNVRMRQVSSDPDIIIKAASLDEKICGEGGFPSSNGKAYPVVKINTSYNYLSASQKLFLIVHELGHNIGFRHTNWYGPGDEGEDPGIQIPGTPSASNPVNTGYPYTGTPYNPDPTSVFNSKSCERSWGGLSPNDLKALSTIYPPRYTISADNTFACSNENVTYSLSGNVPTNTNFSWQSTENAILVSG